MKAYFLPIFILMIVLTAFAPRASLSEPTIGAILPLSGDGALWGVNPRRGIELALKDLRGADGKAPFKVIFEDDKCDPKQAVAAFQKLVEQDGVRIILGPSCSSCSLAVAPLAEKKKVLMVAFSEAASISRFGDYVFRLWVSNDMQGKLLARYGSDGRHYSRAAVISADTAFGQELAEAFNAEFKRSGSTIVAHESYAPDNRDLRSTLLKLRSQNPQVLLVASYPADGISIFKALAGMHWDVPVFAASTLNTPDFFEGVGARAEGTVFADLPDRTTESFRLRWEKEFSDKFPGMQAGGSVFYDFATLLAGGLPGGDSPESLIQYLYNKKDFSGVNGPMAFDANGDITWRHVLLRRENGATRQLDF